MSSAKIASKPREKAPSTAKVVPLHPAPPKSARAPKTPSPKEALGRGAHFARLSRKLSDTRYEAILLDGERIEVGIAPEVDAALCDRCLSEQGILLIGALGEDAVIFGALRTRESVEEEVVIEAPRRLVLRAGKARLVLTREGRIKLSGDDVTIDAPREVRLASAKVEIP
jgi:hypothetical protein